MPSQPFSVVIVARPDGLGNKLRLALPWHEITSHVVESYPHALLLIKAKEVDAVVLRFDIDPDTTAFLHAAKELGIPVIFSGSSTGGSVMPSDDGAGTVSSLVGILTRARQEGVSLRRDPQGAALVSSQ